MDKKDGPLDARIASFSDKEKLHYIAKQIDLHRRLTGLKISAFNAFKTKPHDRALNAKKPSAEDTLEFVASAYYLLSEVTCEMDKFMGKIEEIARGDNPERGAK